MKRYDWPAMKAEYVEGVVVDGATHYPTLDEISAKYGPNDAHLRRRASAEGWVVERNIYQDKLQKAKQDQKVATLASSAAELDTEILQQVWAALGLTRSKLRQLQTEAKGGRIAAIDHLERLTKVILRCQQAGRVALGEGDAQEIIVKLPPELTHG